MWRHIAQSVQGSSHLADDTPCQDHHTARTLGSGPRSVLVACVADGAGSAQHSDLGSQIVCQAIVERAEEHFQSHPEFDDFSGDTARSWCETAREQIRVQADAHGCKPRQFASTLCAAIIAPERSFFLQIGDGAIILRDNGVYAVVFWPQSGEYANSTNFITSDTFAEELEFVSVTRSFADVAVLTDGIERLALVFESQTPHPPFFDPLFHALRSTGDHDPLNDQLRGFLLSESVQSRSDDDKTIILASRCPADVYDAT